MTDQEDNQNINRLKAIRRGNRSVVTKLSNEALEYLNTEDELAETKLSRLETIDNQLQTKLNVLEELNQQLLSVCEIETIEQEIEDSEDILAKILDCRKRIDNKLRPKSKLPVQQASTSSVLQQQQVQTPQVSNPEPLQHVQLQTDQVSQQIEQNPEQNSTVQQVVNEINQSTVTTSPSFVARTRLPKLTLPKFKGNVANWTTFWDSFQSAIHNKDINDVDKFNYLNSLLEGAASRAIKGLTISEANYKSAVEILNERFGKTQHIISAHMDELMKLQPSQNDRPSSLRFIYDKISVHVRGLSSLGVSSDQYGSLLIPIIMSKLPNDIRLQVARKSSKDVWEIDELLQIIKNEVEARETSEGIKIDDNPRKNNGVNSSGQFQGNRPTARSFMANDGQGFTIRCAFCGESHYSASCMKVIDPDGRKDILRKTNRCFNCLRVGHRLSNCQSTKICRHCKGRHHQSICNNRKPPTPEDTNMINANGKDNNPTMEVNVSTTSTTTTVKDKATILLQTARTVVTNSEGTKSAKVRILFDSGSQRSYVSNSLKSRLNLKPIKHETLNLNTFGNNKFRKHNCDLVELYLQDKNGGKIKIRALSFPVICSSLPSRVNVEEIPQLDGLELADDLQYGDDESIDVLIGVDFYWKIVLGEMKRGESGLVASSCCKQ